MLESQKPPKSSACTDGKIKAWRVDHIQIITNQWGRVPVFLFKKSIPIAVGTSCQYFSTNDNSMWLTFLDIMQMKETRLSSFLSREQEMKPVWGLMVPQTCCGVRNEFWKNQAFVHFCFKSELWLEGLAPSHIPSVKPKRMEENLIRMPSFCSLQRAPSLASNWSLPWEAEPQSQRSLYLKPKEHWADSLRIY
jgi:hypothetical protein